MKYQCKFCEKNPAVERSHVIPEYLYKGLYDEKHRLIIIDEKLRKKGIRQNGHYEPILCEACEQYFNITFEKPCETFFNQIPDALKNNILKVDQSCPELKALCFSILWRSSQCKSKEWHVNLGPHEHKIRNSLKSKGTSFPASYQIWGFIPIDENKKTLKGVISPPLLKRIESHHFYLFICGCIQFCINISSHRMRRLSNSYPLIFDKPLVFKSVNWERTPSLFHVFN